MKMALTNFSIRHPWLIMAILVIGTVFFATRFPDVTFDNDPENMLSEDEHVRVFHHKVKEKFSLYDFVIVGIVNDKNPDGVFNTETLGKIDRLTRQLLSLRRDAEGRPEVVDPNSKDGGGAYITPELKSDSAWKRTLGKIFSHDPNDLFVETDTGENATTAIIKPELIAPGVVDNIRQAQLGSLKIEYLMEKPPATREEAMLIRNDAMSNPLYRGTLVSEDEKAICIYIPLVEKKYSYNVANLVRNLTENWDGNEKVYITGLPVAEDTFGVEMLVQMATSAPMAALVIFILLLAFFRRFSLIVAPMILAMVCVICTMGLLIWLGFDVHIMSSMIAIFLMPIAVADSVHIFSEFFDISYRFDTKREAIQYVVGDLFMPMLYTSLTTIAGFASLGLTPIPPVRVFGLHVAFGVALAWVLTMTFVPAYIMIFVPSSIMERKPERTHTGEVKRTGLNRAMEWLGEFSYRRARRILGVTLAVIVISIIGISLIDVNDNPVKWFTRSHPIRIADKVLNSHFGGTYTAYLTLESKQPQSFKCEEKAAFMTEQARKRFGKAFPKATGQFVKKIGEIKQRYNNVNSSDAARCFTDLVEYCEGLDGKMLESWNNLADTVNYLDPSGLTYDKLATAVIDAGKVNAEDKKTLIDRLQEFKNLSGADLQEKALEVCDEYTALSFRDFAFEMEAELTAPLFKQPEVLAYVEKLQKHLAENPVVGKSSSAVDALKKASYELNYVAPPSDANQAEREAYERRNQENFAIPDNPSAVGQVFTQLEGSKKKDSLFHLVTRDYQQANVWVQLTSGDNKDMQSVVEDVAEFAKQNPPPGNLGLEWAGLTYINVVWQDKMVNGMLSSLAGSFVVVLVMMAVLFRSPLFGILSMIPLSVTIAFIYGLIGLTGKDYDMPVAVLSALTLGLSVDFAIHFLERAREMTKEYGDWKSASVHMFKEPAMAISRNAIIISVGFLPLLLAPLVPYRTVGFFLATIMAVSWVSTLFILPASLTMLQKWAFGKTASDVNNKDGKETT